MADNVIVSNGVSTDGDARQSMRQEIYRTILAMQERFAYFFLAASGSAIGLALVQTAEGALACWMLPMALAVVCWGVSFYLGCEHLLVKTRILLANWRTLDIQGGTEPITASNPELVQVALARLRSNADGDNRTSRRFARGQYLFFLLGAAFYVLGHVQRACT